MSGIKFDKDKPKARFIYTNILVAALDSFTNEYIDIPKHFPVLLEEIQKTLDPDKIRKAIRSLMLGASRRNNGKVFLFDIAKVSEFGANKYGQYNYQQGMEYSRVLDALYRHFIKLLGIKFNEVHQDSEQLDSDSGLHHAAHMISNLSMLLYMIENKVGKNDVTKEELKKSTVIITKDSNKVEGFNKGTNAILKDMGLALDSKGRVIRDKLSGEPTPEKFGEDPEEK